MPESSERWVLVSLTGAATRYGALLGNSLIINLQISTPAQNRARVRNRESPTRERGERALPRNDLDRLVALRKQERPSSIDVHHERLLSLVQGLENVPPGRFELPLHGASGHRLCRWSTAAYLGAHCWGDRPDSHRLFRGPHPRASTTSASITVRSRRIALRSIAYQAITLLLS